MVSKVIDKEAQTVAEALLIIESEMAKKQKEDLYNQGSNFSF